MTDNKYYLHFLKNNKLDFILKKMNAEICIFDFFRNSDAIFHN